MYFPVALETAVRGLRMMVRLGLGMVLFALIATAQAHSAPQPSVCHNAISISV
jgi:hypothetical protein